MIFKDGMMDNQSMEGQNFCEQFAMNGESLPDKELSCEKESEYGEYILEEIVEDLFTFSRF